ncbi:MAG: J domain-containing protein [Chloroflexota bacterium]
MAKLVNYYEILGVGPNADDAEIKQAFRTLAKRFSSASEPGARQLKEAYDILTDPYKRQQYDIHLARERSNGASGGQDARWEYLTLRSSRNYGTTKYYVNDVQERDLKNARFSEVINQIGEQGWEMVGIAVVGSDQTYIFKRMAQ